MALLLTAAMLFCTACTDGGTQPAEPPAPEAPEAPETPETPNYDEYNALAEETFLYALDQFVAMGTMPDGTEIEVLGYGQGDWTNKYAICDIDGDGKNELIMRIADTIMASIMENIYSYDEEGDAMLEELLATPVCRYYNGGLAVESGWSHGTGMENEDFWPFNAFVYQPETDSYEFYGSAAQYDLNALKEMGWEDRFPADSDEDGNGIVYEISNGDEVFFADDAAYEEWREGAFGTDGPMELPWHEMKELVHPNG